MPALLRRGVQPLRSRRAHEGARKEQAAPVHHVRKGLHPTGELRETPQKAHARRNRCATNTNDRTSDFKDEISGTERSRKRRGPRQIGGTQASGMQHLQEEVRSAGELREAHAPAFRAGRDGFQRAAELRRLRQEEQIRRR